MTNPLIPRLEGAEVGSRELDEAIAMHLGFSLTHRKYIGAYWIAPSWHFQSEDGDLPDWSTSIDAAVALVEAKLPGWKKALTECDQGSPPIVALWQAELYPRPYRSEEIGCYEGSGATAPLALLSALLKALDQ